MSKNSRQILLIFAAFLAILQFFTETSGQRPEVTIKIDAAASSIVQIEGKAASTSRNLSFLRSLAGATDLGERVSDVKLFDDAGQAVTYKRFVAGEYVADADFVSWSYKIDLTAPKVRTALAHVSWMTQRGGMLMLDDLLPQIAAKDARVTVDLPPTWRAYSQNPSQRENIFSIVDGVKSVIFVGRDLRKVPVLSPGLRLSLVFDSTWNFSDPEAADTAREIYTEYWKLFAAHPKDEVIVSLLKFPQSVSVGNWEADTRGSTVTILSSDMPFKSQSLQRLHEQLRHEMFHLWLPNGVNLTGQYDWFYEGFALYRSLKLGVGVNRIRFEDFLDTLSRAYDIDRLSNQKQSLIESSKNRWSGANTRIYARGMLAAFLCDVEMLESSKGKRSSDNLMREIYEKHRSPAPPTDANSAIIALMRSRPELAPVVERYVTGGDELDWSASLGKAGIEAKTRDQLTRLSVLAKLSGRQKDLLDKLGYNSWRKLGRDKR